MGEIMFKQVRWSGFRKTSLLSILLTSFALIEGCGGGGASGGHWLSNNTVDAPVSPNAPTVTAVVPLNGASGVAINSKLTATFSKSMDPASISTITFKLAGPGGAAIPGTVTYVVASRVATFSPDTNLAASTQCTATVTTGAKDLAGNALATNYVWTFTTGASPDSTAPRIIATINANGDTNVPLNTQEGATFSEPMDPTTLTETTFTLTRGGNAVAGTVTYTGVNAVFTPASNLLPDTLYVAKITTGAKDLAGNPLAADSTWSWTTGAVVETTPPTVTLVSPAEDTINVCINKTVSATFSETMDPATFTNLSFTIRESISGNTVPGTIVYDLILLSKIATFSPDSDLATNTIYTATITTAVKDVAGNTMAVSKVWNFTTGTDTCVEAVALGAAAPFGSFGGASGITNEGILTVVNGDIGTTGASTTVVAFFDSVGDNYGAPDGKVNGRVYTDAPPPGGAGVGGNAFTMAIATQARTDANTAWVNLSPANMPGGIDPGAGQLGGLTLAPGIYKSAGGAFLITGTDLTLDAQGDPNATFVFQMASSLTVGAPGAPRSVILIRGAQAKNVYWQVGSSATINAAGGGTMVGTIISSAATTFSTSGNVAIVTLNGRGLALNAGSTMVNTVINVPSL